MIVQFLFEEGYYSIMELKLFIVDFLFSQKHILLVICTVASPQKAEFPVPFLTSLPRQNIHQLHDICIFTLENVLAVG